MKYTQNGIECQSKRRPQDMKESFRRVLQVTVTKWNFTLGSKSGCQRQEGVLNPFLYSFNGHSVMQADRQIQGSPIGGILRGHHTYFFLSGRDIPLIPFRNSLLKEIVFSWLSFVSLDNKPTVGLIISQNSAHVKHLRKRTKDGVKPARHSTYSG